MPVWKPVINPDAPLDETIADLARYADNVAKHNKRMEDKLPVGKNPMEGVKVMQKTGHDIALTRRDTIHDMMAKNPALYQRLKKEFGQ